MKTSISKRNRELLTILEKLRHKYWLKKCTVLPGYVHAVVIKQSKYDQCVCSVIIGCVWLDLITNSRSQKTVDCSQNGRQSNF
jgi:hypothetical protein